MNDNNNLNNQNGQNDEVTIKIDSNNNYSQVADSNPTVSINPVSTDSTSINNNSVNVVSDNSIPTINISSSDQPSIQSVSPNNISNNNQTGIQTVSTNITTPNVSEVVSNNNLSMPDTNEPNIVNITPVNDNVNNDSNESKNGKFKSILLVIFFVLLFVFIMFLPQISEFFQTGKSNYNSKEVLNGVLVCTIEKSSDVTTTYYQMDLKFSQKKLQSSEYNVTVESEDDSKIQSSDKECKAVREMATDIEGIDVMCTSSDNISTMIQDYNYKLIDNSKLTKFTEAGGFYPEFKYNDDIYNIQSKMIKSGYDCEVKSS